MWRLSLERLCALILSFVRINISGLSDYLFDAFKASAPAQFRRLECMPFSMNKTIYFGWDFPAQLLHKLRYILSVLFIYLGIPHW